MPAEHEIMSIEAINTWCKVLDKMAGLWFVY